MVADPVSDVSTVNWKQFKKNFPRANLRKAVGNLQNFDKSGI